jgi:hypothetical protein
MDTTPLTLTDALYGIVGTLRVEGGEHSRLNLGPVYEAIEKEMQTTKG